MTFNTMPDWMTTDPRMTAAGWAHGWTTTDGPDFRPAPDTPAHASAMARLAAACRLEGIAWVHQVHGGGVLRAHAPGLAGEADALWTDRAGLGVVGRGADCPLILIGGQRLDGSRLWGFAHASWRSTVRGISAALVVQMKGGGLLPESAWAVICPSAGPCCYEVGDEVRREAVARLGEHVAAFFKARGARWHLDLWGANAAQLVAGGVRPSNVVRSGICTICGGDSYPSHRRDGAAASRFAAVICGS